VGLAHIVIGAVIGYAFCESQSAKRDAQYLVVDEMSDLPPLSDQVAAQIEAVLQTGGEVLQRRAGNLLELLVDMGGEQVQRMIIDISGEDPSTFEEELPIEGEINTASGTSRWTPHGEVIDAEFVRTR
jgi:hypothetical protein